MLPYVVFREVCMMVIRECVSLNSPTTNWKLCHAEGHRAIPSFAGC